MLSYNIPRVHSNKVGEGGGGGSLARYVKIMGDICNHLSLSGKPLTLIPRECRHKWEISAFQTVTFGTVLGGFDVQYWTSV